MSTGGDPTSPTDTDLQSACVVCMERKPDVILPCAHCYCRPCIEQWYTVFWYFAKSGSSTCHRHAGAEMKHGRRCPVCRSSNDTDDWVLITDKPQSAELTNYLLSMADG